MNQPLLVLAGGFGTRLRAVVDSVPKALAPAGDAPFLQYLLENWVHQGVHRFVFMLHHQAEVIEDFLHSTRARATLRGASVTTVREATPLGTGGAIANVVRELDLRGSFLVANADTWLGAGVEPLAATAVPALAVVRVPNTQRYGSVNIEGDVVASFAEKTASTGAGWINAGMYHLWADAFAGWSGTAFSVETEMFPRWAGARTLRAARIDADFIDIGVPDDYFRFRQWVEGGKAGAL